jgi:ribose transport system substrate-binding protein
VIKRTGNYLRRDAVVEMEKLVTDGIRVDAIFSESDSMLSGVRMVLSKNNIDPRSIVMVGCDYTSEAQQAIRAGSQSGSVLFPLGGKKAVEIALKIFAKESVPKHIFIPVKLITQENVEHVPPIF